MVQFRMLERKLAALVLPFVTPISEVYSINYTVKKPQPSKEPSTLSNSVWRVVNRSPVPLPHWETQPQSNPS